MTATVLAREGARIGGVLTTTAAFTCRTDSNGTALSVEVSRSPNFNELVGSVTAGTPAVGNNYQATCYVTGLTAGTKYFWRIKATGSAAETTYGTEPLTANSFKTLPDVVDKPWKIGIAGCYNGYQMLNGTHRVRHGITYNNILAQNLDAICHLGDVYYADIGVSTGGYTDYASGNWYKQTAGVDDGTVGHFRTNFITTMDGSVVSAGAMRGLMHVMSAIPGWFMWDDHDRCYNDCDDLANSVGVGEVNKIVNGHQVGHECFMDLNKAFIDQESTRDFATDAQGESTNPAEYYYIDVPPVRFIVCDDRSFRDTNAGADSTSKTMKGSVQKAWIKARIDDNAQPFLALCFPVMMDGDHGWFAATSPADGGKAFSYERDEILDYVRSNGDASRTVILSSDTHAGAVSKYQGNGENSDAIYEFMTAGACWFPPNHGWITGMAGNIFRNGETACDSGEGGELVMMRTDTNTMTIVEGGAGFMKVSILELYTDSNTKGSRVIYTRTYE